MSYLESLPDLLSLTNQDATLRYNKRSGSCPSTQHH
jgi:hypothetical protein